MSTYDRNYLLKSFKIGNFKAVRDSKRIALKPFTVLIGSNGSGKSSLMEALQTHQSIVSGGLSKCFAEDIPFEDLLNKHISGTKKEKAMKFEFVAQLDQFLVDWNMKLKASESFDKLEIASEKLCWQVQKEKNSGNLDRARIKSIDSDLSFFSRLYDEHVISAFEGGLGKEMYSYITAWKFITLVPEHMRTPTPMPVTKEE